ncbi:hypothetical protein ACP70R_014676 [Stipagrostis hirtigluma subsp. patula]
MAHAAMSPPISYLDSIWTAQALHRTAILCDVRNFNAFFIHSQLTHCRPCTQLSRRVSSDRPGAGVPRSLAAVTGGRRRAAAAAMGGCYVGKATKIFLALLAVLAVVGVVLAFRAVLHRSAKSSPNSSPACAAADECQPVLPVPVQQPATAARPPPMPAQNPNFPAPDTASPPPPLLAPPLQQQPPPAAAAVSPPPALTTPPPAAAAVSPPPALAAPPPPAAEIASPPPAFPSSPPPADIATPPPAVAATPPPAALVPPPAASSSSPPPAPEAPSPTAS